jgi:hypothetical protein
VRTCKAVYHGNAGHLLLKGAGPVLRVRIIAPLEFRIEMCRQRLKLSRADAIAYIEKVDQDRRKWTHYLYGVDWGDPALYDLVLNLETITVNDACSIVSAAARQKSFEFRDECITAMNEFALACRVKAELALDPATSHLEVETFSTGGVVSVRGRIASVEEVDEVRRVAGGVPGLAGLDLEALSLSSRQ